jgi:two-component system, NtrC family, response regulator GlrR
MYPLTAKLGKCLEGANRMNILVVDDEIDQIETLKRGLRSKGYVIFEATHPKDALAWLHSKTCIDLLVTDYMMPAMDGLELLETVRKDYPALPVIMMTAHSNDDLLVKALHHNCNGYIEKPFTLEQLIREIERAKANAFRATGKRSRDFPY